MNLIKDALLVPAWILSGYAALAIHAHTGNAQEFISTNAAFTQTSTSDKLPFNPKFPHARYPYAQAPDGCSGLDEDVPELVRDNWGFVDFTNSCNQHDRCFYTLNTSPDDCNSNFRSDLLHECDVRSKSDPTFWPLLPLCKELALGYWGVVQIFSDNTDVFYNAQQLQQEYVDFANQYLGELFRKLTGKSIDDEYLQAGHDSLSNGSIKDFETLIIERLGVDILHKIFNDYLSRSPSHDETIESLEYLTIYGVERLKSETINRNADEIITRINFEITGSVEISPVQRLLFKTRLIQTKSIDEVRTLIVRFHRQTKRTNL